MRRKLLWAFHKLTGYGYSHTTRRDSARAFGFQVTKLTSPSVADPAGLVKSVFILHIWHSAYFYTKG